MSLYTISGNADLHPIKTPAGLSIQESSDIDLLSEIGNLPREEVRQRLANDNMAFVAFLHHQPAAFGWMARGKAKIGELNHELILPLYNRYLWNFRTLEAYRGLGIYPALLQYILQSGSAHASRFWIIHAPENKASLKGIKKAGFQFVGNLYTDVQGKAAIESNAMTSRYRDYLELMDIGISEAAPSSCWNCSSPYLKKRNSACCCSATSEICVVNSILPMAF